MGERHKKHRKPTGSLSCLVVVTLLIFLAKVQPAPAAESVCYGTTAKGRLENGVQLPFSGKNFTAYSRILAGVGRTYVHSRVRAVVVDAYAALERSQPAKRFVYGETGWATGGRIKPHKTHQNGLSVDFMVPVVDAGGNSVPLPTGPFNKYGYGIEFDAKGCAEDHCIDFEALGAHLKALHMAAAKEGIAIWRVIFDPRLQPLLYRTQAGPYLKAHIVIPKKRSWVRHDEHYHVDFKVKCRPLQSE
ncbi:MAG: penicillin-insensitive murein endopeptidase [Desulfosarcinaceae bacterium]|jgi:penicillin-insensitive murein endopeptidase